MENAATADNKHEAIDTYIASLPIAYNAIFIPQSASRNADDKRPSLNWSVTIAPNAGKGTFTRQLTTDYMQGIAHAPDYVQSWNSDGNQNAYYRNVAETGKYNKKLKKFSTGKIDWYGSYNHGYAPKLTLPKPLLRDVLYSLVLDSDVIQYATFEDWAAEFGYETDSRKAEKTYTDCLAIALKLRALIGEKAIADLRELFNDY